MLRTIPLVLALLLATFLPTAHAFDFFGLTAENTDSKNDIIEARKWLARGVAHGKDGNLDQSIESFTKAIDLNPRLDQAFCNRGIAWQKKGDTVKALADFEKALELNPGNTKASHYRTLLMDKTDGKAATAKTGSHLKAEEWFEEGLAKSKGGDYSQAIADFTVALDIAPEYTDAYIQRGIAWDKQEDFDRAIPDYDQALNLDPDAEKVYIYRGIAWDKKGDYDQAIADYNEALKRTPDNAKVLKYRGFAWDKKGDYTQAIEDYTKAIELDPQFAEAYNYRGVAHFKKGEIDRAITDYTKAITIDPQFAEAYNFRGIAWGKQGNIKRAVSDFNKALEINPDYAQKKQDPLSSAHIATMQGRRQQQRKKWPSYTEHKCRSHRESACRFQSTLRGATEDYERGKYRQKDDRGMVRETIRHPGDE